MKKQTFISKIISLINGKQLFSMNRKSSNPIRKRVAKTIRPDREYSYNEISQHVFFTLRNEYKN
ncbi:MAG: hypothetical protein KC454_07805 [Flavobacteriales bacterium]|nr:hypothetical protein [Flavobacteriales bacterium]